jgi:hypothetical protein
VRTTFSPDERQDRVLREAPARLSLHRFERERGPLGATGLADLFVLGYLDGAEGAALDRAVGHQAREFDAEQLAAFAYGWCRGHADLRRHRPSYRQIERWLSRRVGA